MPNGSQTVKTTCCYCGVGCGIEVTRERSGELSLRGDTSHPVNQGMLCSKGRYLHHTVMDRSDRILYPRLRRERSAPHERVDWETALLHAAGVFKGILAVHGPEAVGFYVSGQMTTEEYYVANKLVKGFIGSNNIDTNSRLCMSSAVVGYKTALGEDAPPVSYDDIEQCHCFFIAGANPAWCHPILFRRLEQHKAKNPGTKIIVADPRRTQTCAIADLHLQLYPGTDVTLFNAIAAYLIEHGLIDRAFVEQHTEGFEVLRAQVAGATVEHAAVVCGVPAEAIRQAACWIGESRTFMPMWAMGLNQSAAGVDKNLALLNLSLLTGQIGKPGSGPFSLTGQPNAMGGREVGGLSTMLAAHRDLANPQHRAEVAAFWGVKRLSERPGLTATEMFDALESGTMKAIWIVSTNPAVTVSDLKRVEGGLANAEFVVVQDISERSDAVSFADLVLPAAGWLEKQGTMTNSERRITYLPKLVDASGEAQPDAWILCRFAQKMGWGHAFGYGDESEIFDEHRRLTHGTNIDISGLSYERLKRERSVQWPCPSEDHPGSPRLFADRRFWTSSKRAKLSAVSPGPLPEPPTPDFPLILTTGRIRDQWHTRTRTGKVNRLNRHVPIPRLDIHPQDAATLGIEREESVRVVSRQGEVRVKVELTEDIKPGVVFLPMHWGKMLRGREGRANLLTSRRIDPQSKQPDFKFTGVRIEKIQKRREKIVVVGAGAAARQFVETYRTKNRADEIHVFGMEPHLFYNRILLPDYVAGERSWASLQTMDMQRLAALGVHYHPGVQITGIDREAKEVEDARGRRYTYDKLLLCTGSRAFVPPGVPEGWEGVFSLRTKADADRIRDYLPPGARVLVMGGGLLGLEMAASLYAAGYRCTVIEMAPRLMHRQLDPMGSELLREELEERGMEVVCGDVIEQYLGDGKIGGVVTREGRRLLCDAMIVAVGTRPNIELAAAAGLKHGRGVTVDEHLQTSDPSIYAAGEIAEFNSQLFGITAAAEEQAAVAAAHITGDDWTVYNGSVPFNILKVHGLEVCSMGEVAGPEAGYEEVFFIDRKRRCYKRCILFKDRLVGAVLIGDKAEFAEFRTLITNGIELEEKRLTLLQGGRLAAEPPEGRIVCSCNNVGAGNLEKLIAQGCTSVDELCQRSRAGTGCGSCRPEVRMLLDTHLAAAVPLRKSA
jgi:ferredoxin-nitrate reductase